MVKVEQGRRKNGEGKAKEVPRDKAIWDFVFLSLLNE